MEEQQAEKPFLGFVTRLLQLCTLGLLIATFFRLLGGLWWGFELFCHFQFLYCIVLVVVLIGFTFLRSGRWSLFVAMLLGVNFVGVAPYYYSQEIGKVNQIREEVLAGKRVSLKVVSLNVFSKNRQYKQVLDFIDAENPDVFFLLECTPLWEEELQEISEKYPFSFRQSRQGNFGIAFYSQQPFEQAEFKKLSENNLAIFVEVQIDGKKICLVGAHPYPPGGQSTGLRDQQLLQLREYLNEESIPKIVVGDLNITPWSPVFRRLLHQTKMIDSQYGFGVQGSWRSDLPALMRIPIDHCLHSKEFVVIDRKVGGNVGSDHLPVIVTMALGSR